VRPVGHLRELDRRWIAGLGEVAGDGRVRGVAGALGVRLGLAEDEAEQLSIDNRVVGSVIDPPRSQHPVLSGADKRVVGAVEGFPPLTVRYLVGERVVPRLVGDRRELDPYLTPRVVEPETASLGQLRFAPPRTRSHAAGGSATPAPACSPPRPTR
jgi:hypothetical protein